jgi:ketosteroid isomerase-like protein
MTAEDEVLAVSRDWDAALTSNDAEAVGRFMTDNWVYVDSTGATPKADVIGWIASGRLVHHSMTAEGRPRLARGGSTVVVTARKASSGLWDGVSYTADEWISEVYVHVDGHWQCMFSQKTQALP